MIIAFLMFYLGSAALSIMTSVIGIAIFTAMTAYDTHVAINSHDTGRPDHLQSVLAFYLDFMNLFLSILQLLNIMRD